MPSQPFADWLLQELKTRGWTQSQFAAYAEIETSTVTRWVRHGAIPSAPLARKIADALRLDTHVVLRAAGLMSRVAEDAPTYVPVEIDSRAISIARVLSADPERLELWIDLGETLARRSTGGMDSGL